MARTRQYLVYRNVSDDVGDVSNLARPLDARDQGCIRPAEMSKDFSADPRCTAKRPLALSIVSATARSSGRSLRPPVTSKERKFAEALGDGVGVVQLGLVQLHREQTSRCRSDFVLVRLDDDSGKIRCDR